MAIKNDQGKDRWDLLQWKAIQDVVKVASYGSVKYGDNNWKQDGGLSAARLFAATMRHINAWQKGEVVDTGSGLSHLAHAAWNILAILELDLPAPK